MKWLLTTIKIGLRDFWPLNDPSWPLRSRPRSFESQIHYDSLDPKWLISYDVIRPFQSVRISFPSLHFWIQNSFNLETVRRCPLSNREHSSVRPLGPWSKIETFFESILYNATREGSILDSSLRIFWSCDIFRPIEGRYLSRDFGTRKTLYWNLIFTGFKFSLNSNRMMTHFDDSLWLSLIAEKSS